MSFEKKQDAPSNAPAAIANVAAALARDIFEDKLIDLRPKPGHKIVPEITVSITYRNEKKA